MRLSIYIFCFSFCLFISCSEDTQEDPQLPRDYGVGMYIVTDLGISYYDYKSSTATVKNQIFNIVNNTTLLNPKKIKFNQNKAYIVAENTISIVDIETFADIGLISGFVNPVDIDFISSNRLFVVDQADSKVKVVDLDKLDVMGHIETGDSTNPVFILSNETRSFVLNGGDGTFTNRDSTVISIDYRDGVIPLANFSGDLYVGYNPTSAIMYFNPYILCKGVYDIDDPANNTESSFYMINGATNLVLNSTMLTGIYNANNLVANGTGSFLYFTAVDGIYRINSNSLSYSSVLTNQSNVMAVNQESYAINDSTNYPVSMLYLDDINSPNTIYKYNTYTSSFEDTITVNGNILSISFY